MSHTMTSVICGDSGRVYPVKRAIGTIATGTTDGTLTCDDQSGGATLAATSGKRIRVIFAHFGVAGTATTVVFNSKPAGAGTAITPVMQQAANTNRTLNWNPHGWFQSKLGESITVTTGAAGSNTDVLIGYIEVDF